MNIMDLFGLGDAGTDPSSQLALRAHDDAAANANNGSTATLAPDWSSVQGPSTQVPTVQPAAGATMPAQAAQPVQAAPGGGLKFGNPFGGDPLVSFGGPNPNDDKINPDYGVSQGAVDRANRKAALNTGLLLLAAGSSRDDGARASLLGQIAGASDTSGQLQNMAHLRLEMANARLKNAAAEQQASQMAAQRRLLGLDDSTGGAAPAAPAAATAPTVIPLAAPAPASPMGSVVGAAPVAQAQARTVNGVANAADTAILNAATSGADPAAADPNAASPLAMIPAPAPASQDPAAAAAAGTPPVTTMVPPSGTQFPSAPKDTMPVPNALANGLDPRTLPLAERAAMADLPPEKFAERLNTLNDTMRKQEYTGPSFLDPTTKTLMQPIYANGQLVRSQPLGQEATNSRIFQDDAGNYHQQKLRPDGTVADDSFVVPNSQVRSEKMSDTELGMAKDAATELKTRYAALQNAPQQIARAQKVIKNIDDGTVATGPTVPLGQTVGALLSNWGMAGDKELTQIRNTNDAKALSTMVAAQIAKQNNPGGHITDNDQAVGENIVGAGASGSPQSLKEAMNRYINDKQNDVALYNSDTDTHLQELDRLGLKSGYLKARKIGGDIGTSVPLSNVTPSTAPTNSLSNPGKPDADAVPSSTPALSLLPGANKAPVATAAVPTAAASYLRANPGLKADFDRKYGTGAAASVLGK